jgi:ectoine hydroxylase-related dioxygenase (phytanoyl-CoA dioxygenase family)
MKATEQELKRGKLARKNLSAAADTLRTEGFVVLEGIVPKELLKEVRNAMVSVHQHFFRQYPRSPLGEHSHGKGHGIFGVAPPQEMPFMDPLIVANPIALQVVEEVLGSDFFCDFYNTNNSWPGSRAQHVHRDSDPLFENLPIALPASAVVTSIPLVPFTVATGATQVWPGTHLYPGPYPDETKSFDIWAPDRPSVRMLAPLGAIVLRDPRMWHCGMPNKTKRVRTMLTVSYRHSLLGRNRTRTLVMRHNVWSQLPAEGQHVFRFSQVGN